MRWIGILLYSLIVLTCGALLGGVGYLQHALPDSFTVVAGESVYMGDWVDSIPKDATRSVAQVGVNQSYPARLRLLGVVPIKTVTVRVADTPSVMVCGTPFGIKLYTEGVLVVGLGDVQTAAGGVNPAAAAGICVGDTLLTVDGQPVSSNEELAATINACGGRSVTLRVRRDGVEFSVTFTPVHPVDGTGYRAGMWVRDSTAGVGTLTFYDPKDGTFAGLGHAVSDADTGQQLSLSRGEIVPARIHGVEKSQVGDPGELKAGFDPGTLGQLYRNAVNGLYGKLSTSLLPGISLPVAMKQQVKVGPVQIYTTVDGDGPRYYDAVIRKIRYNASAVTRHMVVEVTDPALLEKTGGIVQGM
ncbi:MAG: PDZ domain-containing protein [Ruminococcaceae bacterium]|nr:PDZ domain-containing protein [Oscillospiraceae bacterium]